MSMIEKIKSIGIITDYLDVHGSATAEKLKTRLEEYEMAASDRTFERLKVEMRDSFGLELVYRDNEYILKRNPNPSQDWLYKIIETVREFDFYKLALEDPKNQSRILFEEAEKPSYYKNLAPIFEAIIKSLKISFIYHFFDSDRFIPIEIEPYLLKKYQQRWYVIGYSSYVDDVRSYGLDRINELLVTDTKFMFDQYQRIIDNYRSIVGLNHSKKPVRMVLRAYDLQRKYLAEVPLHYSQKQIGEGPNWIDFEYHLRPNYELMQQLFRIADQSEIISPMFLRKELIDKLSGVAKNYGLVLQPQEGRN